MKILVVDDDQLAGEMITAILHESGHQVVQTEDAMQALEVLSQQADIELILSDLNMPFISGLELYHELKEQGSTLPFILLTGDNPEPILAAEPGLNACLMKDFSMSDTLPGVIAVVMAAHR